ncbi:MAG: macro domain-containing protein [bacterium]|nr:macro domain-containing protein [bacterium]
MIKLRSGNLFDSNAQTLVNAVNCVGVMGKGIALEFKRRFPGMFEDYRARCLRREVRLGEPYVFESSRLPWILNFPTKGHWRHASRLADIVAGLEALEAHCEDWGLQSLAVPALGCGYGQLRWREVGPLLYRHLGRLGIPVELYAPFGASASESTVAFLAGQEDAS